MKRFWTVTTKLFSAKRLRLRVELVLLIVFLLLAAVSIGSVRAGGGAAMHLASAPTILSVTSDTLNGTYKVGDPDIKIYVNFSEKITVTGIPRLTLNTTPNNEVVDCHGDTDSTVLTCLYTIKPGNHSPDLNYVNNVTCSSVEYFQNSYKSCASAVDGEISTRWSSDYSDPQWLAVDLGYTKNITRVVLTWENALGKDFQIQTSNDGVNWNNIRTVTDNKALVRDMSFTGKSGRYVRMYGTARATNYGYSLWEFSVYGDGGIKLTDNVNLIDLNGGSIKAKNGGVDADIRLPDPGLRFGKSLAESSDLKIDTNPFVESIKFKDPIPTNKPYTNSNSLKFAVTFSEPVDNVDMADFKVFDNIPGPTTTAAITVDSTEFPRLFYVTVSGTDLDTFNGDVGLSIKTSNDIKDKADNSLVASHQPSPNDVYKVDHKRPKVVTVERVGFESTATNPKFTVTFDDDVIGFTGSDVDWSASSNTLGTLTATVTGSAKVYTVEIAGMTGEGTVVVSIPVDAAFDAAGNGNDASTGSASVFYDLAPKVESITPIAPITLIDGQYVTTNKSISFTVKFSEAVIDFDDKVNDLSLSSVPSGAISNVIITPDPDNGAIYQVNMTATKDCKITLSIPAGAAQDEDHLSQNNVASSAIAVEYDSMAPTVTIAQTSGTTPTNQSLIKFTVLFSEDVKDFGKEDISLGNSTILMNAVNDGDIKKIDGKTYEVSINVSDTGGEGDVKVFILADGVTDKAKHGNLVSNEAIVHYDHKAPAPPKIILPVNGIAISNNMPTITGTTDVDSGVVKVIIDGKSPQSATITANNAINSTWAYTPSAMQGEGEHTVEVTAADTLGNTSDKTTIKFTVDTKSDKPTVSIPSLFTDNYTKDTTPEITGTAEANGTVTLHIDGVLYGPTVGTTIAVGSDGTWTYTAPTELSQDKNYVIKAKATDNLGNVSPESDPLTFTLDTTAPDAPIIDFSISASFNHRFTSANFTNDSTPELKGTAKTGGIPEAGGTIEIKIYEADGTTLRLSKSVTVANDGTWSSMVDAVDSLPEGSYTVKIITIDKAHNPSIPENTAGFTVDTTFPIGTTISNPPSVPRSETSNFTFSTNEANLDTFECLLRFPNNTQKTVDCSSYDGLTPTFSPPLQDGAYTLLSVRARDKAGNVEKNSAPNLPFSWTLEQPVTAIPDSRPSNPSFTNNPEFKFSNPHNTVTFICSLDGEPYSACTSPWSRQGVSNKPHTFAIKAVDANNIAGREISYSWVINDTIIKSYPPRVTTDTIAKFSFTTAYSDLNPTSAITAFECRLDKDGAPGKFASCNSGSWTSLPLSPGTYIFLVRAKKDAQIWDTTPAFWKWTVARERTVNRGFNLYTGTSKIPTSWVSSGFMPTDGKDTLFKKEDIASVKIVGDGKVKTLTQTLNLAGVSGAPLIFSFYAKGNLLPTSGVCTAQVILYRAVGLPFTKNIACANGTYTFAKKEISFVAPWAFNKVVIKFTFSKPSGMVWFDLVSLGW